ncbi:MAG TPA: phosphatase PAP2 family protein [Bacillota bacterium]|nr:phosphatase PAP2 family protein [Bacillota bacterium]
MIDLIVRFDQWFILLIHRNAFLKRLDPIVYLISILGSSMFTFPFTMLCMYLNLRLGMELFSSLALCFFAVQFCKYKIQRWRPYHGMMGIEAYGKREIESSFPSGHSSAVVAMSVCLNPYLHLPFLLILAAAIVGYTRIHLGHHYPSDVVGGMIVGAILSTFVVFLLS